MQTLLVFRRFYKDYNEVTIVVYIVRRTKEMKKFLERLYTMKAKKYEKLLLRAMRKLENTSAEDTIMNTYWLNRFMEYSDKKRKYELLLG